MALLRKKNLQKIGEYTITMNWNASKWTSLFQFVFKLFFLSLSLANSWPFCGCPQWNSGVPLHCVIGDRTQKWSALGAACIIINNHFKNKIIHIISKINERILVWRCFVLFWFRLLKVQIFVTSSYIARIYTNIIKASQPFVNSTSLRAFSVHYLSPVFCLYGQPFRH